MAPAKSPHHTAFKSHKSIYASIQFLAINIFGYQSKNDRDFLE